MWTARTIFPQHQAQDPSIEVPARPAIPARCLGLRQRLYLWGAGRQRTCSQRLDDLWDAQRERVQFLPTDSYLNIMTQTRPGLGLVFYISIS
jgi:hypothetical protein